MDEKKLNELILKLQESKERQEIIFKIRMSTTGYILEIKPFENNLFYGHTIRVISDIVKELQLIFYITQENEKPLLVIHD